MLVDLHLHSTYSDGRYTPEELVRAAVDKQIKVIAITDHDSWNGFDRAFAEAERHNKGQAEPAIRVLRGVELSTQLEQNDIHVLGYHVSADCVPLLEKMNELRHKREHRLEAMVEKCRALGMDITVEACDPRARTVGRPHIAKVMVAKGYVASVQEAFDKYLHRGGPCYVEQPKLSPKEAVELIHQAKGLAVLAHPSEIRDKSFPEQLVSSLPFDGIEIWHPSVLEDGNKEKWLNLAKQYNLLVSGGSDFHGIPDRFPAELGLWKVLYENTAELINYRA